MKANPLQNTPFALYTASSPKFWSKSPIYFTLKLLLSLWVISMGSFSTYKNCWPLVAICLCRWLCDWSFVSFFGGLRRQRLPLHRDNNATGLPENIIPSPGIHAQRQPWIQVSFPWTRQISSTYGFHEEIMKKYGSNSIWKLYNETFDYLPLAALVNSSSINM